MSWIGRWRDQSIFLFLQGLAALGTIVLGKIIAVYFEPAEYGKYFIASSATGLFLIVAVGPVVQAYRHFHYQEDQYQLIVFYRSVLTWLSVILLIILVLVGITGRLPVYMGALAVSQVFFHMQGALHQANINIQGKTTLQAILQLLIPLINLGLILLILAMTVHAEFTTLWTALVLTEMTMMVLSYTVFRDNQNIGMISLKQIWHSDKLKGLIKFIRPLLLLPVFAWFLNNADRYLLSFFYSQVEVGLYSAAYSIGSKIFILLSGGIVAFYNAPVYQLAVDRNNYGVLYKQSFRRIQAYLLVGIFIVGLIYLSADFIGALLLSDKYKPAFALIPILAFTHLILSTAMLMEQGLYAIGKTKYVLYHYIVGTVINLTFNLILIPRYGMWGATYAMLISTVVQIVVLYILFKKALVRNK